MQEISFEEFKERDGSPMVFVSADERTFYDNGDTLAAFARYNEDDGTTRFGASILTFSTFYEQYRTSDSRYEVAEREQGIERAREKVMDWLQNQ